jgi:hypothetical protein
LRNTSASAHSPSAKYPSSLLNKMCIISRPEAK